MLGSFRSSTCDTPYFVTLTFYPAKIVANPISVDQIAQTGSANCAFKGVDGAQLAILGANTGATLAPPQTLTTGSCQ